MTRVPGLRRARALARRIRSRLVPHVVILGYHRVTSEPIDPFDLSVTPEEFDAHMALLARVARPVPLAKAQEELRGGTIAPRTVVVTLDDGYEDTLTQALPVLERHGVPATVFITSGNPGAPFWWDALAAALFGPTRLPSRLALRIGGAERSWDTAHRSRLAREVAGALRPLDARARDDALARLTQWSGAGGAPASPRALTHDAIRALAAHPLVSIGAHSVTHPPLALRDAAVQREEILGSRRALESFIGRPVTTFSYPHGSFNATTQDIVREAGFTAACCSVMDVARRRSDPLALPRLWVDGPGRRRFPTWLTSWL